MSTSTRDIELRRRRAAACQALEGIGADALVTDRPENVQYLSGYPMVGNGPSPVRPVIAVLFGSGELVMVGPAQEGQAIQREASNVRTEIYGAPQLVPSDMVLPNGKLQFAPTAWEHLRAVVSSGSAETVAVDGLRATFPPATRFEDVLRGPQLIDGSALLAQLRMHKSDWELDRMRDAAQKLQEAFAVVAPDLRAGMTEIDVQRRMCIAILDSGAGISFAYAVVVGGGREIFASPTDRAWVPGEVLYLDAGALVDGYTSDFCRMYVAGTPSTGQVETYQRLVDARDAAVAAFRAGMTAGDLANVMVGVLGVGPEHVAGRYGHGLGSSLEPPSLNPADPTILEDGTVFCLEPALLVDGTYYALEEEYAVREGELVLLSPAAPRELLAAR